MLTEVGVNNPCITQCNKTRKVAVLSKWFFVKRRFTSVNRRITVMWQFYKCKLADYSKVVVYKCKVVDYSKVAVYKCKLVDYSKVAVYKCKVVDYSKAAVYKCKLVVYKCKLAVYTSKVLNSRFTTVLLISLLDTVEVTPFFQFLFGKAVVYRCKLLLYYKPPLYKL